MDLAQFLKDAICFKNTSFTITAKQVVPLINILIQKQNFLCATRCLSCFKILGDFWTKVTRLRQFKKTGCLSVLRVMCVESVLLGIILTALCYSQTIMNITTCPSPWIKIAMKKVVDSVLVWYPTTKQSRLVFSVCSYSNWSCSSCLNCTTLLLKINSCR